MRIWCSLLGVLGQGKLKTKKQLEKRKEEDGSLRKLLEASDEQSEQEKKVSAALQKVADELRNGISITAVALAYVLQKALYVFPIVGGRKTSICKIISSHLSILVSQLVS